MGDNWNLLKEMGQKRNHNYYVTQRKEKVPSCGVKVFWSGDWNQFKYWLEMEVNKRLNFSGKKAIMWLFRGTSTSSIQDKLKTGKIGIQVFSIPVHPLFFIRSFPKYNRYLQNSYTFYNQFFWPTLCKWKNALKIPNSNQIAQW